MSLLTEFEEEKKLYIESNLFIYLLKLELNEPFENIVSYLKRHNFDKVIDTYEIDSFSRIIRQDDYDEDGHNRKTLNLLKEFQQLSMFWNKICAGFFVDPDENTGRLFEFYYKISDLNKLGFITRLKLDFNNQNKVSYVKSFIAADRKRMKAMYLRPMTGSHNDPHIFQQILFRQDVFSIDEAASLLSGTPLEAVKDNYNRPHFTTYYSSFLKYKNYILKAIDDKRININKNEDDLIIIDSINLQYFLFNDGYVLKGFNDWLTLEPAKPKVHTKSIEDDDQTKDYLSIILDETHEYHAPDLKHAIKLWVDLYINGDIKDDSHSNKANQWIKNNTGYSSDATSSITRIREVATPFKDFGAKRSREIK